MATKQTPLENAQTSLLLPELNPSSLFSEGLTGSELAARLRVKPSTIKRAWQPDGKPPRPQYFAKWSRDYSKSPRGEKLADPDGLTWTKRGDRYYPITEA